jgi:phosphoribosylformylglycinamidine synthase
MELTKKLSHYRISPSEYEKICSMLTRPPQGVEWALFSALWSEHCSYKSSRVHLKKFAETLDSKVVNALGENAGVIDLGFGEQVVFKMESHNHPSFIEPYQGAATGVGGILRDIFTMGARPIANANFLCFGEPTGAGSGRMRELVDGVVRGISGYGNCVGVPTVTGFTEFDESYNNNILVNAMSVGLLRPNDKVALSAAQGPGNLVVYVGAKTGKDGVHGAAMASESFDDNSEVKKPNVQIGDPYFEKLLIESCLEVLQKDLVVAIQDMGAAGLTSSSFEMASKGKVGMRLDLSRVPLRDSSMTPEEILLSESQERMLLICEPVKLTEIQKTFARWGLDAVAVGKVTQNPKMQLFWRGEMLTEIHPDLLVEEAPKYERPYRPWSSPKKIPRISDSQIKEGKDAVAESLWSYLQTPMGSTRQPIYRQYDQRVGALTARACESSVSFQRLPDSARGLAIAVGCRPHLMRLDARIGALDAVVYPALQMAVKGARAIAVTDCLNFGNPEKIEIMSEFVASVDAITAAAKVFETPVISGNVSFYNETLGRNITSTPATGLVGIREHVEGIPFDQFQAEGNVVYLLQLPLVKHNSLEFEGDLDLEKLKFLTDSCYEIAQKSALASSRVVGRKGLAFALARHSLGNMGLSLETPLSSADLLGEVLYQVILELDSNRQDEILRLLRNYEDSGLRHTRLGRVVAGSLDLGVHGQFKLKDLRDRYENGFLTLLR